ncbi:Syn8 snare [Lecanosticta acicola]|uniref:Syn8 snare n=1 Tax=Lecanosticta acicola TaxID=111012 RepID=A0AAI9ECI8_9PEZI|nr:Syn8 snare [Lecanosticta acicola]
MSSSSPKQLFLLADHLKLSLLERQRAISLNLEPSKHDAHISRSLAQLQEGLEAQSDDTEGLRRLRQQYADLYAQFHGSAPPSHSTQQPNDPALAEDFAAARSQPSTKSPRNKSVRFRDDPGEDGDDAVAQANRASLFSDQERYRDEPAAPDQTSMDNQQIHDYHRQVLQDQDEQLDSLGQSVGRQRMLGIQMGNEIDEQNVMLEDVEAGVDGHSNTLDRAQRRLTSVSRKAKANWNWITIAILVVILLLVIIVLK